MNVIEIQGIGPKFAEKLEAAGITTVQHLLEKGATKKQREGLVETTEISDTYILKWCNHADMIRIKGVGPRFAELLEVAGVDTVPELARRNAENLTAKLVEVNEEEEKVDRVPTLHEVEAWIEEAKTLPRVLTY